MTFYIPNGLDGKAVSDGKREFDAYGSHGILREMGRYAKNLTAALGVAYVLAAPGCGRSPASPTPTTCNPACVAPQTCINNGGNYSCQNPTPTSSLVITKPAANAKPATPLDIEYTSSSQGANHADFTIDNGEVYHDTTLDGRFQLPEKRPDGTDIISGGGHTLAGYLVDANENKLAGSDSAVAFSVISVTGDITDRIAGGGVGGSTITWTGPVTKSARANSPYTINGLPAGDYEVTITGNHVTHKNLKVPVTDTGSFPFSVLQWNSGRFGATYDATFDNFYQKFARASDPVVKWVMDSVKPTEIYVTLDGLSPAAATEFRAIFEEVNNESTSDIFCGEVGPLPITYGSSIGLYKTSTIVVGFSNDTRATGTSYDISTSPPPFGYVVRSAHITYYIDDFDDSIGNIQPRIFKKYAAVHELAHTNGSSHAFNTYPDSIMGGWSNVTRLSKEDKLASCIIVNKDTHPANRKPDTNPTWAYK